MNATRCEREDELLEALERAFVPADLDEHVHGCEACSELRLVAGALLDDRAVAVKEAAVPSAGAMWWRMRVRQQREAVAAARRSLLIGQAATLVVAAGLAVALFGGNIASGARELVQAVHLTTPVLVAAGVLAVWMIAAPLAGWAALRQK
jgi:hypothetical protein